METRCHNHQNSTITKDFNGLPIVFREDGYINMTKAAKAFGKKDAYEFTRLPSTHDYIHAIAQVYVEEGKAGIFPVNADGAHMLYEVKKGRNGGTFCHPKLAVFFARWLDVRFAVWCDLMIGFGRSYCVVTTSYRATFRQL